MSKIPFDKGVHMKQITFRLKPGELLKEAIEKAVLEHGIEAGCMLSLVGSLSHTVLRMADAAVGHEPVKEWGAPMEIVSATGTVSTEGIHIHISVADKEGTVFGGHLTSGCIVHTTVEVVVLVFNDVQYERVHDKTTGFQELRVS